MMGQLEIRWQWLLLALSGLMIAHVAVAAEPDSPRLVVVLATVKGAPPLKPQVAKLVEAPLASKAVLIPYATYLKAAKAAGMKPAAAETSTAIPMVGKRVGATRVLLLKAVVEPGEVGASAPPAPGKKGKGAKGKKGKKANKNFALEAVLYDVATGQVLLTSTYPLANGKKLLPEVGQQLVREVVPKLAPSAREDVPIASPIPEPALVPIVPTPAPEPTPIAAPQPMAPLEPEVRQVPVQPVETISPFAPVAQTAPDNPQIVEPPLAPVSRTLALRPGLNFRIGWLAWHRDAEIKAKPGEQPPLYSTTRDPVDRNKYNIGFPSLGRLAAQVELYPFAFGGEGHFHEGIGIYGDGSFGLVQSGSANGQVVVTSQVYDVRGGVNYRLVFWDSPASIEGQLRLGINAYGFPLRQSAFPSFSYFGPALGAQLTIPLGIPWFQVFLGADISRFGALGANTTTFLGAVNGITSADTFQGGFRGLIPLEALKLDISVLAQFQQYGANFRGPTRLQDVVQFDNVSYTEQSYGLLLMAGLSL